MLQITDLHVNTVDTDKPILKGIELTVNPGEVHLLRGVNGSGKSTLAQTLAAHPGFEITKGEIWLRDEPDDAQDQRIDQLSATDRSLAGIFVTSQQPIEVPGVDLGNFLFLAYNARRESPARAGDFRELLKERAKLLNYPTELLSRNLNEGFSGGEKKKTEVMQLAVLEPKYAVLDETDSGLDQQATKDVFTGLNKLRELWPHMGLMVITHYEKVLEYIKPTHSHEMQGGQLIDIK